MRQKGLPASIGQKESGLLIILTFRIVTTLAGHGHIARNMQPCSEAVHAIQMFHSGPIMLQIAGAIEAAVAKRINDSL